MSFESAFYNKYADLTKHSSRELLKTLLALYNHTKTIAVLNKRISEKFSEAERIEMYHSICLIQEDFLSKREILCNANEAICFQIKNRRDNITDSYNHLLMIPKILPNSLTYIKRKKYHYEQICHEHKIILDKQDAWMVSAISSITKIKTTLTPPTNTP